MSTPTMLARPPYDPELGAMPAAGPLPEKITFIEGAGLETPTIYRKDDHAVDRAQKLTFNDKNIAEFRSNGGRISYFGDAPVLLLTTTGAKSGQPRTSPMMYLADDHEPNRVYVFASAAGADTNPAWFHNIVAHPKNLGVEIDRDTMTADAEVLPDPLREQVYAVQASRYPGFAGYQTMTTRPIPVIALTSHR